MRADPSPRRAPVSPRTSALLLALLGVASVVLTTLAVATALASDRSAHHRHLLLYVAAALPWALAYALLPRLAPARWHLALVFIASVLMRLLAWAQPPAHSDDVYRYLWDGQVQRAGHNPYEHAPADPTLAPLRDARFALVNNRELPTIYPPLAELAFAAVARAPGDPLVAWKVLIAACDLGLLVLLVLALGRAGGDPRRALLWGWSPLAAIELAGNAHVDVLAILLLTAALFASERGRLVWAGLLLGASAAAKGLAAAVVPGLRSRRALFACAGAFALCALPYAGAGTKMTGSLGEYARRWRGNDGAFALLHAASGAALAHTRFGAPVDLGFAPRLARLMTGRDRDQVYPDEAVNFVARALAFGLFTAALVLAFLARASPREFAEVALGAYLLLSPTLHPWYVLFILPIVSARARPAWLALAALAPLGYWPLADYRAGLPWVDPVWTRILIHGAAWSLLAIQALTRRRPRVTSESW